MSEQKEMYCLKIEESLLEEMQTTADYRGITIHELTKWAITRMIFDSRGVRWSPKKSPTSGTET
ncbi:MAG TPA: hypothetical protein EYF95_02155 [Flavobacteriales bacterium]|jgi:hypothetical protein|nr:hypothetical protein [Flavobacteriales bacterium]